MDSAVTKMVGSPSLRNDLMEAFFRSHKANVKSLQSTDTHCHDTVSIVVRNAFRSGMKSTELLSE